MLYVFVEGPDDEHYFDKIYAPRFREEFGGYQILTYAHWKKEKINHFLQTIPRIPGQDYRFFGDADGKSMESRKSELAVQYPSLSPDKIFIVQYEIESWYYAGIDENICKSLKLKHYEYATDTLTKENFYNKLPARPDRIVIMRKMLDCYSLPLALPRNQSLSVFDQAL